ncbi:ATP-binding cassette domain-containing protein [Streptomyces sp. NPDC051572]|uniref:ATP-binding cassette domain-containing protein n=1 Tax=unclassified Streptomyces TaxID=2593676 RepID=UPI00344B78BF
MLHSVRLELPAGKRLAVVGVTGSSKSTLASLVAGLRLPSSGRVTLGGAGSCW